MGKGKRVIQKVKQAFSAGPSGGGSPPALSCQGYEKHALTLPQEGTRAVRVLREFLEGRIEPVLRPWLRADDDWVVGAVGVDILDGLERSGTYNHTNGNVSRLTSLFLVFRFLRERIVLPTNHGRARRMGPLTAS
jgi:hypothetical protein